MRAMAADFFARSPVMAAPVVAMLLFLAVFIAVAIRVFLTNRSEFSKVERLPLDGDGPLEGESQHE